jgi:integrase
MSEALNILKSDIDIDNQSVTIETLKRRKRGVIRSIPIPKEYMRSLDDVFDLRSTKDRNKPLWDFTRTTGWRIIDKIMKSANLSGAKACAKGVRHSFAITCVNHKIPLNMIAKWMGHADMATTAIYADAVGEEEINLIARLWNDS